MKAPVITPDAPAAIGPYSQAIRDGDLIFVSGQLPIDPATGQFPSEEIKEQTRMSLENVKHILAQEGYDMSRVVKTTVLLKDIADFAEMNEVYKLYFSEPYPARSAFQVGALPKDARIEIEVIAR